MKITGIKQQVKRADRYSIYIDEKYVCSFSESELLSLGLRIGQELTPAGLEELKNNAVRDKAYTRALDLLSRRARSEWELRSYLKRKEYEEPLIDEIVNMLSNRGYVDDVDFARRWINNRHLLKPTSKRRLVQELRQKHISSDIITRVLEEDETDERTVLREIVERKRSRYPDPLKFMQYLMRQGYNYDDIKSVLNEDSE